MIQPPFPPYTTAPVVAPKKFNLLLPATQKAKLDELSVRTGYSVADLVRSAITRFLENIDK